MQRPQSLIQALKPCVMPSGALIGLSMALLASTGTAATERAQAASAARGPQAISCSLTDSHPVCKASYALHPSGTLGPMGVSTGSATVEGASVKFTCKAGDAPGRQPRSCRW